MGGDVGIDVHKRESHVCVLTDDGAILERRIRTEAPRFATLLAERPRVRTLLARPRPRVKG